MTILDDAADYAHLKGIESDTRAALKPLTERIKDHLQTGGSDYTVDRLDRKTGELVAALELRESNVRLFLRDTAGAWHTCANCDEDIQCRKPSKSLIQEPIVDLAAAARVAQWRAPEVSE